MDLLVPARAERHLADGGRCAAADCPAAVMVSAGKTFCTGLLIGPGVVMTAAHGVKPAVWVTSGHSSKTAAQCACHPKYTGRVPWFDVALCRLMTAADPRQGIQTMASRHAPYIEQPATYVGYGVASLVGLLPTRGRGVATSDGAGVLSITTNSIEYGDSGGPVFLDAGTGHGPIVGIISRMPSGRAPAKAVDLTYDEVREWVDCYLADMDARRSRYAAAGRQDGIR